MSFLACSGLVKRFGEHLALDGIDFSLERGECLVLLGPSGCGKSTLLNLLTGTLAADAGTLRCDGRLLDDPATGVHLPMHQRGFAMVFQDFSLWPHMSVLENVNFGLRLRGVGRAERDRRALEALAQVQMADFAKRLPSTLSGGQQQRVAIARALVVRPNVLLMDEPLSALDARLRDDLKLEVGRLIREHGLTAIYVTHDQSEAFALGDRIALMRDGRIEQLDTPQGLYKQPANHFVASFVGRSNLLPYQRLDSQIRIADGLHLPRPMQDIPEKGWLLVRREQVRIEAAAANGQLNGHLNGGIHLEGQCRGRQYLGDRHEVLAELAPGLSLHGVAAEDHAIGGRVAIHIAPESLRFLAA
jgi:ABC-type Fe3+/spermidine/putrescine transport system ATPase subunit